MPGRPPAPLPARGVQPSRRDQILWPVHRWVWRDVDRRARKLLRFAETEADGGRHLARAAELTSDALLRRLFLRHSQDEDRHAELFRCRGRALRHGRPGPHAGGFDADWLAPGERGLDHLEVGALSEEDLLAFLHFSEKAAAGRFALYRDMLEGDDDTRDVFTDVLHDEEFHMNYTKTQLARVAIARSRRALWRGRAGRLWKTYLRLAVALASVFGTVMLTLQYYFLLPVFALLAKRAARGEAIGWHARLPAAGAALESQY